MKRYLLALGLFIFSTGIKAQNLALIPYPQKVTTHNTSLLIKKGIPFVTQNAAFDKEVNYLNTQLGLKGKSGQMITVSIDAAIGKAEAYRLNISANKITLKGASKAGGFNGIITLLQLYRSAETQKGNVVLPGIAIADEPLYAWRGFMLDESRHFFGKAAVKDLLNWMAFYKLNRFHWHLTDAQGWRIEIKKYPLLTTIGGRGNFTDSTASPRFYTQKDIKEIVAYASSRHIEVIPEIDMPGHATAANHAYPQYSGGKVPGYEDFTFNPGKEATYQFIANILKELKGLFPAGKIHIGGDEVALGIKAWQTNADVQKLMARHGFTGTQEAEAYFLKRIADTVAKLNYKAMCWDEAVAANLPVKNVIINWWRQNKPGSLDTALAKGYPVILSPRLPMYLDFVQDSTHRSGRKWDGRYNTYLDMYHFPENGLAKQIYQNEHILGLQANLWSETVISQKRLQYLLFPRIAALAEACWNPADAKNDDLLNASLKKHYVYYKKAGIYYYDGADASHRKEVIDVKPKPDEQD